MSRRLTTDLAAPPPADVLEASAALTERLATDGLHARHAIYESIALERNIALSGRRAHPRRHELRNELRDHLAYWSAVNRIRAGRHREPEVLEDFAQEYLPPCEPDEFIARASTGDGITGYELRNFKIGDGGRLPRLTAQNCRLIDGRLEGMQVDHLSLTQCSLVDAVLACSIAESVDASVLAMCGGGLKLTVDKPNSASFQNSTFRATTLTIVADEADFSWCDLALDQFNPQYELMALAGDVMAVESAPADTRVEFRDAKLPKASFVRTFLQGTYFDNTVLTRADFSGATLDHAEFYQCDLRGCRFGSGQGMGDDDLRAASVDNTTFRECVLDRDAAFDGAVGVPQVVAPRLP